MQKVLIATFSHRPNGKRTSVNGMIEPLLSYFLPKNQDVDVIDGFHPGSSNVITIVEQYRKRILQKTSVTLTSLLLFPFLILRNSNGTRIVFKLRDLLSVIEWGIRADKKYDLFIGLESIYTIGGIFLKKAGKVKKVIYYVSDYSPSRYKSNIFNKLYLSLDRFCATHCDYIWDVSDAMQKGRLSSGLDEKKSAPVIVVNNALFPGQISALNFKELTPHSLVFAGTLGLENGPDIAIKSVKILIKKFPDIQLHVFGGNEEGKEDTLKRLVEKLELKDRVVFHGFVGNAQLLTKSINKFMIGLAPYKRRKNSVRAFGDATKLRLYMGAGLPTITTDVPPLGKELERKGSVLITDDDEKAFAEAIKKVFESNTYIKMRKKAIEFSKQNTWENTYATALRKSANED